MENERQSFDGMAVHLGIRRNGLVDLRNIFVLQSRPVKPFRLVPDLPPKERARKKNAMLNRLEKEKLVKIEANVGAGPQVVNPMVPCEVCGWSFPKAAKHRCKESQT